MSSNMRIGGLASGMDIDQIVKDLMKIQNMKMDKLKQEKQIFEWQQEDYRTINSTLRSFRDNQVFQMKLQSTYLARNATSSNENTVKATASSLAHEGTHRITVKNLAEGASLTSSAKISATENLATLNDQFGTAHTDPLDFVVNDVIFQMDPQTESIYDLVGRINQHSSAGVSLNTTQRATATEAQVQKLKLADSALAEGLTITIGDKKVALWDSTNSQYESESIAKSALKADVLYDIASLTTGDAVVDAIKSDIDDGTLAITGATLTKTDVGELTITSNEVGAEKAVTAKVAGGKSWDVRASYDSTVDRFFLFTNKTGEDQKLEVVNNTLAQQLKLTDAATPTVNAISNGTNADVVIDGMEITEYKSNEFTLNGVTYRLQNADPAATTIIQVQTDNDAVYNSIKSFIDEYNKLMDTLDTKLNEKRYKDYTWPLTEDQQEKLTDNQIDMWKEKARSGMLRNDNTLRDIRDKLRSTMGELSKIGIVTTSDYFSSKLEIKEDTLKKAIQNDLQGVMDVFTGSGDGVDGVGQKLSDHVSSGISTIIEKAGANGNKADDDSFLGKRIDNVNDDIDNLEDRLKQIEDRYWRQFSAMEAAINKLNQQSSWLMQQFGGGA
ncbi:flagellar hook-associated 2 domain protein [Desulforamulus reducens MI-1]|uniref:Flagellar hook-associated protein 2 n=1 Tax=Desulforamulus reducens (strain ATCC BAA-1160 / DSM 100696 / MI-1) TaxID=349161 RepID=A4J775_DESRM|nr:flagellar filament capping protein FliD [Desulforamulus reducens]ABO50928.1 flagellar hook-associated 2 domain protein [Desulforamulus reducens MI-1]